MRIRLSNNQKQILKMIGMGVEIASSFMAPGLGQMLYTRDTKKKYRYKQSFKNLVENDVVYLFGERVMLTEKGKQLLKYVEVDELFVEKNSKWDNVWHLVSYDIPEPKKHERDYLRGQLVKMGFLQIQDSLWVIPYECKQEIAVMSQNLSVAPFVAYLCTDSLPKQKQLMQHFGLDLTGDK